MQQSYINQAVRFFKLYSLETGTPIELYNFIPSLYCTRAAITSAYYTKTLVYYYEYISSIESKPNDST